MNPEDRKKLSSIIRAHPNIDGDVRYRAVENNP
jgi:hypothetical protein